MAVFLVIMNPTEFRLVHNDKKNRHYDHIPFNLKGIRNRFLCVCAEENVVTETKWMHGLVIANPRKLTFFRRHDVKDTALDIFAKILLKIYQFFRLTINSFNMSFQGQIYRFSQ